MSSDDRDSIVSSLISLSESICERAMELQEQKNAEDIVERGRKLQKKSKSVHNKAGKKSLKTPTQNDVQIHCCEIQKVKKTYRKASPLFVVDLKKSDSYDQVINKICDVVELEDKQEDSQYRLFTARGAVIPDADIVIGDDRMEWTLGGLLNKRHVAPDKLTLGVGILEDAYEYSLSGEASITTQHSRKRSQHCETMSSPRRKASKIVDKSTRRSACPQWSSFKQKIMVYYSPEDELTAWSRKEVWNMSNTDEMDKAGNCVFHPETVGFRVSQIIMLDKDGSEVPILQPDTNGNVVPCQQLEGDSLLCFNSCTNVELMSFVPVPLVVLCRTHPSCKYVWLCLNSQSMKFPSTPVIHIRDPFMYKCSVFVNDKHTFTVNFDVTYKPITTSSDDNTMSLDEVVGIVTTPITSSVTSSQSLHESALLTGKKPSQSAIETIHSFASLQFGVKEIMESTNNFNKENKIGSGGFGTVFLGNNLRCSGTTAAIKVLSKEGTEALVRSSESKLVETELKALMKFRHPNILQIMGYCYHEDLKALVYRFMENGSLYEWIYGFPKCGSQNPDKKLQWSQRISILKDLFQGVAYLHSANPPLVHQDVKTQNVLIDKHFQAVIGDFGFAIELPKSVSGRTLVTAPFIARTEGYFAPEIANGQLSPLSDVYSCGVVVLETYSGLHPYDTRRTDRSLVDFTEDHRKGEDAKEKFLSLADSAIGKPDLAVSEMFRKVSNSCLERYSQRPVAKTALLLWNN